MQIDAGYINEVLNLNEAFFKSEGRRRVARVVTFGCKMNENDSEKIMGLLEQMGYDIELPQAAGKFGNPAPLGSIGTLNATPDGRQAPPEAPQDSQDGRQAPPEAPLRAPEAARLPDLVKLNTCCVRKNAEQRFLGILGALKRYKADDPSRVLAVCGCMMQEGGAVAGILEKHGYVDFIFGTKAIAELPALLGGLFKRRGRPAAIAVSNNLDSDEPEDWPQMKRKAPPLALISIMTGCDNFCSYCIVPYVRGRERSRPPGSVVREAERLAAAGYREILLLGQNVNSYGNNSTNPDANANAYAGVNAGANANIDSDFCDFAGLLGRLSEIDGIWRIRFMTSHPKDLSDRLIYAIRDLGAVCPQLHLPIQSGSDAVLERMNRGYSRSGYLELVRKIRREVPGIALSTDVIVGFPGEGGRDFEDTLGLVEAVRFDLAYTFLYSPREGTAAAGYADQVPAHVAKARFDRLVAAQNEIGRQKNQECVGKTYEVLCEGASKTNAERLTGRTPCGKVVNFSIGGGGSCSGAAAGGWPVGQIVEVRVDKAGAWSLDGTALNYTGGSRRAAARL